MGILRHRLPSQPYARDLIGVAAYVLAVAAIAAALYVGMRATAPIVLSGAASTSDALDRWTEPGGDVAYQPSNFQRWMANRDAAKQPAAELQPVQSMQPVTAAAPVATGPVGVAAAAREKALSEISSGRGGRAGLQPSRDDAALPPEAKPAEQTGFTPPPVRDQHKVY